MSTTKFELEAIDPRYRDDSVPPLGRVPRVLANPNLKGEMTFSREPVIVLVGSDDVLTASRERVLQSDGFLVISRTAAEELMLNPPQARALTLLTESVDTWAAAIILARVGHAGFANVAQILDPWASTRRTKMCKVILSSELTSPGKLISEVRSILGC